MKTKIIENFEIFILEISDIEKHLEIEKLEVINKIQNFFSDEKKQWQLFNHDTLASQENDLAEFISSINDLFDTIDEDDCFSIKFNVEKNPENIIKIFSPTNFVNSLPTEIESELYQWSRFICNCTELVMPKLRIHIEKHNIAASPPQKRIPYNDDFNPEKLKTILNELPVENALSRHLKKLLSKYCLTILASTYESNPNSSPTYSFEGYAKIVILIEDENDYIDCHENIFEVTKEIYIDRNFNTRLGILKNIISINKSTSLKNIFNDDLLKILHSNYQIYLKENITQYIEVKNKTIELMHNLVNKATDKFEEKQKNHQKVLIGLATYIFTIILGKVVLKSPINVFSFETTLTTTFFILFIFLYINSAEKTLEKTRTNLTKQMDRLRSRYQHILHDTELEEIFNEDDITGCFNESNMFLTTMAYYILLFVTCIAMWVVYFINRALA